LAIPTEVEGSIKIVIPVKLVLRKESIGLNKAPQSSKVSLLKLGLIGFVFPLSKGLIYFHNPLLKIVYVSFVFT